MVPLFRYIGGKSNEIPRIKNHIPKDYQLYLEPFCGGASLYFNLQPSKAVINDTHEELINFYQSIQQGKGNEIYDYMENTANDATTYYRVRDEILTDDLDRAKRFFYQRKTCFRGLVRYNKKGKFNVSFGDNKIDYEILKDDRYEKLLQGCEILGKDYSFIFENYNDENNFMFIDPPYNEVYNNYGKGSFGNEEQQRLANYFKTTKIKCLMIINKTPFIEKLYTGYITEEYGKKYSIGSNKINKTNKTTTHLIIKNY